MFDHSNQKTASIIKTLLEKFKANHLDIQQNVCLKDKHFFALSVKARLYFRPNSIEELQKALSIIQAYPYPYAILGEGSNIVPSYEDLSVFIIHTIFLNHFEIQGYKLLAQAGCSVSNIILACSYFNLDAFSFLYGMPGTLGGALWMNARCYGQQISQCVDFVDILEKGQIKRIYFHSHQWDYKKSPFQNPNIFILQAQFHLTPSSKARVQASMQTHYLDRLNKGHYRFPCAGSIFKNDPFLPLPVGALIEQWGLCGYHIGDAMIAPYHGNIFINKAHAGVKDVLELIRFVQNYALEKKKIHLQAEVVVLG